MNGLTKIFTGGLVLVLAVVGLVSLLNRPEAKLGQSQAGLRSTLATSSTVAIGQNSVVVLFATTTAVTGDSGAQCLSRVITTKADPLLIMFSPGVGEGNYGSTSLQNGFFDAIVPASTTQSFDSGIFGCGAWIGKGNGASTTISVSEFR